MIDLTFGADLSGPEPVGSVTGTMCGLEVEFEQSIQPPGRSSPWKKCSARCTTLCHRVKRSAVPAGGGRFFAYRIGRGPLRVSLIGGCHADEPVGPRFLLRLVRFLAGAAGAELRRGRDVVRHPAYKPGRGGGECGLADHRRRIGTTSSRISATGFGNSPGTTSNSASPHGAADAGARPENRAAWQFWQGGAPYHLHVSMHGMSVAAGPYFLVERSWWQRLGEMAATLTREVEGAGVHPARCGAAR